MGDTTEIEWADATWNVTYGCTKVSPACAKCYIERSFPYRTARMRFERGRIPVHLLADRLEWPLRKTKPLRIFVNSLSDLYHEDIPLEFILEVEAVMSKATWHQFLVLTKRPDRMLEVVNRHVGFAAPNIWRGVTAENQHWLNRRWCVLRQVNAAVRFVSMEPLLGAADLSRVDYGWQAREVFEQLGDPAYAKTITDGTHIANALTGEWTDGWDRGADAARLDWLIVGGESANMGTPYGRARALIERCTIDNPGGPAYVHAGKDCLLCGGTGWRPKATALAQVRRLRDQCLASGTKLLFKQWGGMTPKAAGRLLDGRTWDEFPRQLAA